MILITVSIYHDVGYLVIKPKSQKLPIEASKLVRTKLLSIVFIQVESESEKAALVTVRFYDFPSVRGKFQLNKLVKSL